MRKDLSVINNIFRTLNARKLCFIKIMVWILFLICSWFQKWNKSCSTEGGKSQKDCGGFVVTHGIVEKNIMWKYIVHAAT